MGSFKHDILLNQLYHFEIEIKVLNLEHFTMKTKNNLSSTVTGALT